MAVPDCHRWSGSQVDFPFEFADGAAHHAKIDQVAFLDKTGQQRLIADGVDQPGNAVAVVENAPECRAGELGLALRAGLREPVLNVLGNFGARQWREMIAHRDALAKLAQARAVEPVTQLRLAEQYNLQQLAI